ncbi:MAG: ribosome silencing factor [Candidatus Fluviicola riflensis]|nr:MAG: ribosome silencing factor [Candidatus Fluviicola riflensis]OGS76160.1 MAG: ribosome silencing factor [Candidatus Fluviicola riflensis]OGS83296.1 MAG: ribosome silencing factor [Fluviicola sp. RIFCSPHIGHO2_01_FULL_43_53]OGS83692.1 MAG: ribosome silencing factor [Fluviicola sp. RIFCSPHIGHO2_12_FULL_43_24]
MYKLKQDTDSQILCNAIVEGMQENKAKDIVVLDLRNIANAVTDFFVICSGESSTQVDGISSTVTRHTRQELQEKPWHQEGKTNSEWILLDYVSVVAHIFYKDARHFYELEDLWSDAIRTNIPNLN